MNPRMHASMHARFIEGIPPCPPASPQTCRPALWHACHSACGHATMQASLRAGREVFSRSMRISSLFSLAGLLANRCILFTLTCNTGMGFFDEDFAECPNCGNEESGYSIYECQNCEFRGCYYGELTTILTGAGGCYASADCPRCDSGKTPERLGQIVPSSDDDE